MNIQEPVNLTNLRTMTDGDPVMEKMLFKSFISSFEEGMSFLKENAQSENMDIWRQKAHSLVGISINLGAEKLSSICYNAEVNFNDTIENKNDLLQKMQIEYLVVKEFLLGLY